MGWHNGLVMLDAGLVRVWRCAVGKGGGSASRTGMRRGWVAYLGVFVVKSSMFTDEERTQQDSRGHADLRRPMCFCFNLEMGRDAGIEVVPAVEPCFGEHVEGPSRIGAPLVCCEVSELKVLISRDAVSDEVDALAVQRLHGLVVAVHGAQLLHAPENGLGTSTRPP